MQGANWEEFLHQLCSGSDSYINESQRTTKQWLPKKQNLLVYFLN